MLHGTASVHEEAEGRSMWKAFLVLCSLTLLVVLTSCADLQKAVTSGSLADVETAIAKGEDVNKKDGDGNTPLIIAAKHGDFGIVLALLKKGADLKVKNKEGYDALLTLSAYSMPGPSTPATSDKAPKPIGITLEGHLKTAGYLIDQGADVNAKNNDGCTALLLAAQLNKKELVELLLSKGADVNAPDQRGQTALMAAAIQGQPEVVCPLIRKGAKLDTKDAEGNTALWYAEKFRNGEVATLLQNPCPAGSGPSFKENAGSPGKPMDRKMESERVLEKLIESLRDQDPAIRTESARRLGELKDSRTVAPLIAALKDEHPYVRRRAAFSLGSMQDIRAVEPLIKVLDDEDPFVREYALKALEKISGQRFGTDSKKWQEWWDRKIRQN